MKITVGKKEENYLLFEKFEYSITIYFLNEMRTLSLKYYCI